MTEPLADRILQVVDEAINAHLCTCEDECRPQRSRDAAEAVIRLLAESAWFDPHVLYLTPADLYALADEIEQPATSGGGILCRETHGGQIPNPHYHPPSFWDRDTTGDDDA